MNQTTKRHFPIFYTIYFSVILLVIIAVAIAAAYLVGILGEYEQSQPKYAAEAIYERYFENGIKYDELLDISGYELSEFESKAELVRYLNEQNSGEMSYYRVTSGVDAAICKYIVKMGSVKICTFTLEADENKDSRFDSYSLASLELYYTPVQSVSVTVPSDTTLYLNGKAADDRYIVESGIKTDSCDYMPVGVDGITLKRYEIDGLLYQPTIEAKTEGGTSCEISESGDGIYTASVPYDSALEAEWHDKVIDIVKAYAVYMQGDSYFGSISGYFEYGSDLYEMIRTVENMFVVSHYAWSFENESASEFYRYDDNTFSCRVSVTHLLHRWGADDYKDFIDMTLYFRKTDGSYYIYNRQNH